MHSLIRDLIHFFVFLVYIGILGQSPYPLAGPLYLSISPLISRYWMCNIGINQF